MLLANGPDEVLEPPRLDHSYRQRVRVREPVLFSLHCALHCVVKEKVQNLAAAKGELR
jgi:hypothetical protein